MTQPLIGLDGVARVIAYLAQQRKADPNANKATLVAAYTSAFNPQVNRSVYIGAGYAVRFCETNTPTFTGTAIGLKQVLKYDAIPLVVVVVRPTTLEFRLANLTFVTKASHSSAKLSLQRVVGSVNGGDIETHHAGVANAPEHFTELWAMHLGENTSDNLRRVVEATAGIVPSTRPYKPSDADRDTILDAPARAHGWLAAPSFAALEADLTQRVAAATPRILAAAAIDNVKLRGDAIEAAVTGAKSGHALCDLEHDDGSFHVCVDVKSSLTSAASAPKAYHVDRALQWLAQPRSVLAFLFVQVDLTAALVTPTLVPVLDRTVLARTGVQPHWSSKASRGTTQFTGNYLPAGPPQVDVAAAQAFLADLLSR